MINLGLNLVLNGCSVHGNEFVVDVIGIELDLSVFGFLYLVFEL